MGNNKIVIILMGIIIVILAVLCVLFATNKISFNSSVNNIKETSNDKEMISQEESSNLVDNNAIFCNSLVGNYEFSEAVQGGGDSNNVISSVWNYQLTITKNSDLCVANLYIDGFQTMKRLKLNVVNENNNYNFVFDGYLEETTGDYKIGDILFSMYNLNNNLYTKWNILQPNLDVNKTDNVYFKIK